jgi:benzylsuccinate CoA-transferase BbsE subunit
MAMSHGLESPLNGVLNGIRVVDWTDQDGAYAARLLADLGADVVRLETSPDALMWPEEPIELEGVARVSAFERFVNLNKRSVWLDARKETGRVVIGQIFAIADVIVTSGTTDAEWRLANPDDEQAYGPHAIHVTVSGFGAFGPGAHMTSDDLVILASGGLLSLGGYPDGEPIAVYGNQTYFAGGISAAIATLLALIGRESGLEVRNVDVSAQAVIAGALEDAPAEYDLTGSIRQAAGDEPREAGTGTFACSDGWIAIVAGKLGTAKAWDSLINWLMDEGVPGAEEFTGPDWKRLEQRRRPESISRFRLVFELFLRNWDRQSFYAEGQRRGISVAPVNSLPDLLADVQLADRHFFREIDDNLVGQRLTYPGAPYRLPDHSQVPWTSAPACGCDTSAVLGNWLGMDETRLTELHRTGVTR